MSVIIRLQNLPWSANALDIRQFFKGLSIPEGGVHIVGGEMGDAFIAFSTDEDARQAMMHDREKINEVQVRLLLSSRAEMQKVIETARQQSLLAFQNANAIATKTPTPLPTPQPPVITTNSLQNILSSTAPSFLAYQQEAGITLPASEKPGSGLDNVTNSRRNSNEGGRDRRRSSSRERRRSRSRDRGDRTNSSRRRRDRSRSRSRDRDYKGRRSNRRSRSRDRSRDRSRERSHERSRNGGRSNSSKDKDISSRNNKESSNKLRGNDLLNDNQRPKTHGISAWNIPPANAYQSNVPSSPSLLSSPNAFSVVGATAAATGGPIINPFNVGTQARGALGMPNTYGSGSVEIPSLSSTSNAPGPTIIPAFQSYTTSSTTTNNYSINLLGSSNSNSSDSIKPFALQNPYTAGLNTNSQDSNSSSVVTGSPAQPIAYGSLGAQDKKAETSQQEKPSSDRSLNAAQLSNEPIAFANTNPYAQMYPNLFAQAASAGLSGRITNNPPQQNDVNSAKDEHKSSEKLAESCCIKVSNMCGSTTYSDLRKFFAGLFIPHNGIKMVNDKHGLRIGVAYIQFSRVSSVHKAMTRNNTILKAKQIRLEVVPDVEFESVEDSFRPQHRYDRNNDRPNYGNRNESERLDDGLQKGDNGVAENANPFSSKPQEPFTVLYIEDIPSLATELDIMKMFSNYTIYDILLTSSPENRREFIAYVRFSREDEAKAALENKSKHVIGYRKVRVRQGKLELMEKAKEKLRLANEQLLKEEQAMAEEEERKRQEESEKANSANGDEAQGNESASNMTDHDQDDEAMLIEDDDNDNDRPVLNNQDPRSANIPSLFDLAPTKPAGLKTKEGPSDPRLRRQRQSRFDQPMDQMNIGNNSNMNMNPNFNLNMNNLMPFLNNPMNALNFNNSIAPFAPMISIEQNFVIMKNCDYNTRMNEVAELFMSANLRCNHIELLRNERKMPTGEFIVEFQSPQDAQNAISEFNNTQFRLRTLKMRSITPQEIADRLGKPFMNYVPGGGRNGPMMSQAKGPFDFQNRGGMGPGQLSNLMDFRGTGGSGGGNGGGISQRFNGGGNNNNNNSNNNFGGMPPGRGGRNNNNNGGGNRNRFRGGRGSSGGNFNQNDRDKDDINDDGDEEQNALENSQLDDDDDDNNDMGNDNSGEGGDGGGIPEKFQRAGCVVAMENVPFKAELKDILKFFSDFDLTPDDIIRRFNDDGSPTGDARVAFKTPAMARAAFDGRQRKQIFGRTIHLHKL